MKSSLSACMCGLLLYRNGSESEIVFFFLLQTTLVVTDDFGPNGAKGRAVFSPALSVSLVVTLYRVSQLVHESSSLCYSDAVHSVLHSPWKWRTMRSWGSSMVHGLGFINGTCGVHQWCMGFIIHFQWCVKTFTTAVFSTKRQNTCMYFAVQGFLGYPSGI